MWMTTVLLVILAIVNSASATLGSDLDEDGFRRLKEVENDGGSVESDLNVSDEEQNDEEEGRTFYNKGLWIVGWTFRRTLVPFSSIISLLRSLLFLDPNPNALDHENLDEFEKLRSNPPFPTFNDELEDESSRKKRDARKDKIPKIKPSKKKRKNKMDESIRDTPDAPENSKFNGLNL
jgi:hypothetical protein